MRLFKIHSWVRNFKPSLVVVDPMSNLITSGNLNQTKNFFMRLIDYLKSQKITVFLTDLTGGNVGYDNEQTEVGVSSLMDTWLELQTLRINGERNRILYILKSRGMAHSNQVREFILSNDGVDLIEAYIGEGQVLTGTQRINQILEEEAIAKRRQQALELSKRNFERKKYLLQAKIDALQMKLASQDEELEVLMLEEKEFKQTMLANRNLIKKSRHIYQNP